MIMKATSKKLNCNVPSCHSGTEPINKSAGPINSCGAGPINSRNWPWHCALQLLFPSLGPAAAAFGTGTALAGLGAACERIDALFTGGLPQAFLVGARPTIIQSSVQPASVASALITKSSILRNLPRKCSRKMRPFRMTAGLVTM